MIELKEYSCEYEDKIVQQIIEFWKFHNSATTRDEAIEDINNWTRKDHYLYAISYKNKIVGFLHLSYRGSTVAWIEDIFVEEDFRGKGIASKAIESSEIICKNKGSSALCMDVVPSNHNAIKLYHKLGYDRLSLITVRKDFEERKSSGEEILSGLSFKI